jgi:hypothetical protein
MDARAFGVRNILEWAGAWSQSPAKNELIEEKS